MLRRLLRLVLPVTLIFCTISVSAAQTGGHRIYAAVLANKNYVVGARNAGVGLFMSPDQGRSWHNMAFSNMRTFAIEVFPDHGAGLIYTANGNGVIVSRDGGISWRVTTGWRITETLEAAADPQNPATVYVGSAYGLWKSERYGEDWQRLTRRHVSGLYLDPAEPTHIYVGEEDGLLISRDAGASFSRVDGISDGVNQITQDPAHPDRVYVGSENQGIFISDDRGGSFRHVSGPFARATLFSITVDPHDSNRVFAGSYEFGVFASSDRGETWRALSHGLEDIAVYEVAFDPEAPNLIYAGTVDRGIFFSDDGGLQWRPFGLDGTHVLEIEIK